MKLQIFALILLPSSFLRGKKNTKSDFFHHFSGFGVFFAFPLSWFNIKGYKIMITDMCTLHWYQWLAHFERSLWHLRHQRIFFLRLQKSGLNVSFIYIAYTQSVWIFTYINTLKNFKHEGLYQQNALSLLIFFSLQATNYE